MKINQALPIVAIVVAVAVVSGGVYYAQDANTGAPVDDSLSIPHNQLYLDPCDKVSQHIDCTHDVEALDNEGTENEAHNSNKPNDASGGHTIAGTRG